MIKYSSKQELIQARANEYHEYELTCGSVFDHNGNRVSDMGQCIEFSDEEVTYIGLPYAKMFGLPFDSNAWYIKDFGYCEAVL